MGLIDHAVKRGLEHPSTLKLLKRAAEEGPKIEIPSWGIGLLVSTFVVFLVFLSAMEYTLYDVVATLAMVETPSAAITVSPSVETAPKESKEGLLETGPTITLVHQKPITSSIRGTIRHLTSLAGRFSRWRGIRSHVIYSLCLGITQNVFDQIIPRVPGRVLVIAALSGALCANLHASWTHKVISMPSNLNFFKRIAPRSQWKRLAVPAAVHSSAGFFTIYVAQLYTALIGLDQVHNDNFADYTSNDWVSLGMKLLSVFGIMLGCCLFIVLPAYVTLIRVESSILPEEHDTIVPFDRTFGGKVVPQILGGTGCVGFLDAWKSFNWEARRRLLKLYAKIFVIVSVVFLTIAHVLAFEIWAIMGPAIGKAMAQAQQQQGL